ncbi:hypothetical protein G9C85_18050 [Halorubellus sp. JP-L1]|uniref:hypothetical protein n=1 Tax=Halorubellus sp. JP-L1 TaxID=2715753 RepID=UPI00140B246F|nr:hypothetical protein [Halorubellus sp. JP-L1]NHN43525.1 hypothetical protein [Halorubellus sp. JP-L1]
MSWRERVDELLYEGESVERTVDVGANRVYVTSHRVLAFFDEDAAGPNFRQVDRPNVEGVGAGSDSDWLRLARAVVWGGLGLASVVGGVLVEFGSFVSVPENLQSGAVGGTGGIVSLFADLVAALALVDEAIAVLGVLFLAVAAYHGYRYAESRERVVTVGVAGAEDVRLVVTGDPSAHASELRQALGESSTRHA